MSHLLPSEDNRIHCMALLNYIEQMRAELQNVTNPDLKINFEWRIERAQILLAEVNQNGMRTAQFVNNEAH